MTKDPMQELTDAAARVAVHELLATYATAVDASRWDLLDEVFVEGSVVDFSGNGGPRMAYPEIRDYLSTALDIFVATQHLFMNHVLDVDGDVVTGRFQCLTKMIALVDGGETVSADGGYYDVRCQRFEDGWRITELVAALVWLEGVWPDGVPRPAWYGQSGQRY